MTDLSHLNALELRLSHEREYLAQAKTVDECQMRKIWIAQIEREIAAEYKFLGIEPVECDLSDDELFAELGK